jgi:hypothetical protein
MSAYKESLFLPLWKKIVLCVLGLAEGPKVSELTNRLQVSSQFLEIC